MNFDQQAPPTRHIAALDFHCVGGDTTAAQHPGSEPGFDLGRQVTDQITVRQMHPDAGVVVDRWAGQNQELVTDMNASQVTGSIAEHGSVDGGPETGRVLGRQRRWRPVCH